MRAFATFLQIESSALSRILSGRRRISLETYLRLVERLGLSPAEVERLRPGPLTRRKRLGSSAEPSAAPNDYRQLSLDAFQVIADWYHYAILELTQTSHFVPQARWVARRLGITVSEVNIAVERLKRLEMLRIDEAGRWIDESGAMTSIHNDYTNVALRKLQKQILEGALAAIDETSIDRRDQTAMTMAISTDLLPEAKRRIARFRRELCAFLKDASTRDEVYQLSLSLYPVTRSLNTKGEAK